MTHTGTQQSIFRERARAIAPKLTALRQTIHAHPELSFGERETVKLVARELEQLGLVPQILLDGIAVMAELGSGERTVVVRADMDALPIEEDNAASYCSQNRGVMHACGHDAHTACGLGAAMLLVERHAQTPLPGRVRFLFQPAEEQVNAQGKSGAGMMIEAGAVQGVTAAIALHVFPDLPVGTIALKDGALLSACDSFEITIKGEAAHGAFPHLGVDAVVLASHVVQAIQTITSRRKSALEPAVITLGGMRTTTFRPNIVAEAVEIVGTARYFNSALLQHCQDELHRCCGIATAMGGSYTMSYTPENPPLLNDTKVTEIVRRAAARVLGDEAVVAATAQLGADDFAFISAAAPSCYFVLGAEIKGDQRKLHTPTFDIDEAALPIGAAVLAEAALELLQ